MLCVLAMCLQVFGKTNIWGTPPGNQQFSAVVGSDSATAAWMWSPVDQFNWGLRLTGLLTGAADQRASTWDTTMVGVGVEFPAVNFNSILEDLPLQGQAFLALSVDMDIENNYRLYVPVDVGIDTKINDHLSFRVTKSLTEIANGNDIPTADWRFGCAIRW